MLVRNYFQVSKARIVQLMHQFHRGSKKFMDYLVKVKTIYDSVAVVKSQVLDR